MPLNCSIERGALMIRAVGDQQVGDGLAQLEAGIELARDVFDRTGLRPHTFIDLSASEESKSTPELQQIVGYFAANTPPLSGRLAMVAPQDLLFGLARVFSGYGESSGLEAAVFRTPEEAWIWLEGGPKA
ncbi:MAG: hypothetical protein AAF458_05555 [Pseudomonadota bacterium]